MIRKIDFSPRPKMLEGVRKLYEAVSCTLGPKGYNVLFETTMLPKITKDGVTVSWRIALEDPLENMAAQVVRQAAAKVADDAGDGTTTVTILAYNIIKEAFKDNRAPIDIKRELEAESIKLINTLNNVYSKELETENDILNIATISANNDSYIGNIVKDAYVKAGKHGRIIVEDGKTLETTVESSDGYTFKRSYVSPYFIQDQKTATVTMANPLVFIYDKKLRYANEVTPVLDLAVRYKRPLLIICEELEGQALGTVLTNHTRGIVNVCAVQSPNYGIRRKEVLQDIALITGGTLIDTDVALIPQDVKIEHLGSALKVLVDKESTTLFTDKTKYEDKLEEHVSNLKSQLDTALNTYERERYSERLAKLTNGLVIIKVGAVNEVEAHEIKDRLDDSIRAVKAAIEKGIVPGAGKVLYMLSNESNSKILQVALKSPFYKILENANVAPEAIITNKDFQIENNGYNIVSERIEDLISAGIIDPTKVIEEAIRNSVSVANQIIMTKVAILEDDGKKDFDHTEILEGNAF